MSATYYIVLLALLAVMLMIISPNFRGIAAGGICIWFWMFCLLLAGLIGRYFGRTTVTSASLGENMLAAFIGRFFVVGFVSIAAYLFFYCIVGFGIFAYLEKSQQVKLVRPSVWLGCIISLISPIVLDVIFHNFRR